MKQFLQTDIVIVGGGIIGLSIAKELSGQQPKLKIAILEKEQSLGCHASGRNSGVIHAGFYYSPDSLKARMTAQGNRLLTEYCLHNNLRINRCGKVVVAKNERELDVLHVLKTRGEKNGVVLHVMDEKELEKIEPNARTYRQALYSPSTATLDPLEVVGHVAKALKGRVDIFLGEKFLKREDEGLIVTTNLRIRYRHLFNAAGLYADSVAHEFGVGRRYTVIPFKGLYMTYPDSGIITRHIYPVPDMRNPFLGVHFTKTVDGEIMIGPTATPALWRENYGGLSRFSPTEFLEILYREAQLFLANPNDFRRLVREEIRKYSRKYLLRQASALVRNAVPGKYGPFLEAGIRAQLLDTETMTFVMDFVVEHGDRSTHILNAVSPAFTSAFSFSRFIVDECEKRDAFSP